LANILQTLIEIPQCYPNPRKKQSVGVINKNALLQTVFFWQFCSCNVLGGGSIWVVYR